MAEESSMSQCRYLTHTATKGSLSRWLKLLNQLKAVLKTECQPPSNLVRRQKRTDKFSISLWMLFQQGSHGTKPTVQKTQSQLGQCHLSRAAALMSMVHRKVRSMWSHRWFPNIWCQRTMLCRASVVKAVSVIVEASTKVITSGVRTSWSKGWFSLMPRVTNSKGETDHHSMSMAQMSLAMMHTREQTRVWTKSTTPTTLYLIIAIKTSQWSRFPGNAVKLPLAEEAQPRMKSTKTCWRLTLLRLAKGTTTLMSRRKAGEVPEHRLTLSQMRPHRTTQESLSKFLR